MQQPPRHDQKSENRMFLACYVLGLTGIALRATELAGLWGGL